MGNINLYGGQPGVWGVGASERDSLEDSPESTEGTLPIVLSSFWSPLTFLRTSHLDTQAAELESEQFKTSVSFMSKDQKKTATELYDAIKDGTGHADLKKVSAPCVQQTYTACICMPRALHILRKTGMWDRSVAVCIGPR